MEDSANLLPNNLVAHNVQSLKMLELAAMTKEARLGSTADRMKIYGNGEALKCMHRRTLILLPADSNPNFDRRRFIDRYLPVIMISGRQ